MSDSKRKITIEDLTCIRNIDDPQLSPDGKWIAYVVKQTNTLRTGYETHLYMVATDGGQPIQLTRGGKESTPRWSPDGAHLAFVSARDERPQIYIMPMAHAGEPRPLTKHETGATNPAWSPDGTQIAYTVRMSAAERSAEDSDDDSDDTPAPPADELAGKHRKERKQADEQQRFDPRPMHRIPYREGTSYRDDRYNQIYVIPAGDDLPHAERRPRRLTDVDADYSAPQWSADGKTIYSIRAYDIESDDYFYKFNLYAIDVENATEQRMIDETYTYWGFRVSPDGKWMAVNRRVPGKTYQLTECVVLSLVDDDEFHINAALDREIASYDWTTDNQLLVLIPRDARMEIHRVDPQTQQFDAITTADQSLWGMSVGTDGSVAYVSRTPTRLDELFYQAAGSDEAHQLTEINEAFRQDVLIGETHHITYTDSAGVEIDGWYVLPPDYEAGKAYPLALNIHGGPHVMWTPSNRAIWHEWQTHAAAGYIVFFCNPRGSGGYGADFQGAVLNNWGDVAMEDILLGVDQLIDQGLVDPERMAITGGSYGGYMTSWIIGKNPGKFKSAVAQRGVYNLVSFVGTTDVPILIESEFETTPWEDHNKLWTHSPVAYAHNITTPTLIIHSENDFRVPIEQAEQLFATIRRATDTPVKMLRYPREGHELSRSGEPRHRISRLSEMVAWFDQYIKPDGE